ncbi:DUF4893 domain-containing protein [Sphingomonas arenae]|uniref:DUF4893 domain-containing protein n=1 Tax=Sphingomonas arenae TaxID=2812555 RepID=UPI0019677649|nr:DUF4893 domain-containing protein [Sphingomonas arenae]
MRLTPLLILVALALSGCTTTNKEPERRPVVVVEPPRKADAWLRVASADDADRISRLSSAWAAALSEARRAGFADAIAKEGNLLKADAALARPAPTPGSYNCRLVRLGRYTPKTKAFESFKPFFCYVEVEGELLTIVKQTGSERPAGRLWEDDVQTRMIFLGSVALGNEEQPLAYGDNKARDMAGVLERIAPFRWRLVVPWPRAQSKLDVFELTPVAAQPAAE